MINQGEILQTIEMIDQQHLDVRTITMGISLRDCADEDIAKSCDKVYDKICRYAKDLVKTGEDIEAEFGIPIVNKRISVTPIAIVGDSCKAQNFTPYAIALDKAAKEVGVNFLGGFSALVHKGFTTGDTRLIESIPEALATTDFVCSSVNVGTTRAGINMDAVRKMGQIIKQTAEITADRAGFGCAKLVVFCNAVEDPGSFACPPNIEACLAPVEEKTNGVFVINASIAGVGAVTAPVKVTVENGIIVSIEGGSDAEMLKDILTKPNNPNCFRISELGIGLNPCAIPCGSLLEDEAPLGTVHIAAGNNASNFPGGQVSAPVHIDMIAKESTVYIDDVAILVDGEFQYSAIN